MTDLPERMAAMEAKLASQTRDISELSRQNTAMWNRVDEMKTAVDLFKLESAKDGARMETRLSEMDKTSLREAFGMKSQIAEIGWRVGIIVGAALLVLNFIISKIDIGAMFQTAPATATKAKR